MIRYAILAAALLATPAVAVTVIDKGGILSGTQFDSHIPVVPHGSILRYHPIWADQARENELPGAICVGDEQGPREWYSRSGKCVIAKAPVCIVDCEPVEPPCVVNCAPPPPTAIPLPAGVWLLLAALGGLGLLRRARG